MQKLREALGYLDGASFANYSGQIVEQKDGKDHLIICDLGCTCGEVASKNTEEYGEVLVAVLNGAREVLAELDAYEQVITDALQSVWDEMRAGATFDNPMLAVAARIALKRLERNEG